MALDQTPYIDYDDDDESASGEKEMTFIEHLEELRWHIIRSVAAIFDFYDSCMGHDGKNL